jgi:endonuclease/exonuclease/phosphatase family metal-dependent hydrolase
MAAGRSRQAVKIISWNLRHSIGAGVEQVAALYALHRPDVMLMQEATTPIDTLPARIGGHYARVVLPGRHHGLAAWSLLPPDSPASALPLQRGVLVRRVCQILDFGVFAIANVHLSHGQVLNRWQLRQIARVLPLRAAIIGDCNMVGAPLLRGFIDAGLRQPTHRSARLVPLRLDRCFIRGLDCINAEILPRGQSDHKPLLLEIVPAAAASVAPK